MSDAAAPLLRVERLVKTFPVRGTGDSLYAVNDVSFTIAAGETLALVGESGSGKTTVARCVLRLTQPTSGRILLDGQDLVRMRGRDLRRLRPRMQIVFQDPLRSLNPRLTASAAIRAPMSLVGLSSQQEQRERLRELADAIELPWERLDLYPRELTSGEQQKVAIARALATRPRFVVLDEPTSSLDPLARAEILKRLLALQRDTGVSYLFISHDLAAARKLARRIAVMYLGKIVETSTTQRIFDGPRHPYTEALLSALRPIRPDGRQRIVLEGEIPSPVNLPQGCFFYSRCFRSGPECLTAHPALVPVGPDHEAACYRASADSGYSAPRPPVAVAVGTSDRSDRHPEPV